MTNKTTKALKIDEAIATLELVLNDGADHGNWPLNKNCEDGLKCLVAIRTCLEQVSEVSQETEALKLAEWEKQEPVAYLVTGPYEKHAFADIGSAEAYCRGLNKGFGDAAYSVSPLYAAPVSEKREACCQQRDTKEYEEMVKRQRQYLNQDGSRKDGVAEYAAPVSAPKREWVDLTPIELAEAFSDKGSADAGIRAVIAAFKEKNK